MVLNLKRIMSAPVILDIIPAVKSSDTVSPDGPDRFRCPMGHRADPGAWSTPWGQPVDGGRNRSKREAYRNIESPAPE